jgi:hypothetical protein
MDTIEASAKAIEQTLHPLATELATNVWRLHEPYYAHFPNDFQDLRAEVVQYLTEIPENNAAVDAIRDLPHLSEDLAKGPSAYEETMRAYRDAARLLESGWTPPAQASPVEREAERTPPREERTPSETRGEATRAVPLAEHIQELEAEWRGSLDRRERDMIADELKATRALLKEQDPIAGRAALTRDAKPVGMLETELIEDRPMRAGEQIQPEQDIRSAPGREVGAERLARHQGGDYKTPGDDIGTTIARLSTETGLPHTPTVGGEFVAGIYRQSLRLSSGQFAMIDNGLGFALVPWTPELDRHLGRHVAGVAQESGGIEWSFGRKRGLEI